MIQNADILSKDDEEKVYGLCFLPLLRKERQDSTDILQEIKERKNVL